ncbi:hypothetical protein ACKKBF_B19265 [Auxenochlorella protothecoides x Auxenochlorella symbiontica]
MRKLQERGNPQGTYTSPREHLQFLTLYTSGYVENFVAGATAILPTMSVPYSLRRRFSNIFVEFSMGRAMRTGSKIIGGTTAGGTFLHQRASTSLRMQGCCCAMTWGNAILLLAQS